MYRPRRIAVIGSGAAALGAAWMLSRQHEVVIFEQSSHAGGHANTVVTDEGQAVDTGFIVFNDRNYPNLVRLFEYLKVPSVDTDMSFAVSLDHGALEYRGGGGLRALFGQPSNLLSPRFLGMVTDVLRFYREAPAFIESGDLTISLGDYLQRNNYGQAFIEDHLLPMAAAIWSAPSSIMLEFPAASFIRFCRNHGLLQLKDRPQWRTVRGGSRVYVRRLLDDTKAEVRLNSPALGVRRMAEGIQIVSRDHGAETFDEVVLGCHADQALSLLLEPTEAQRRLLGAFSYQENLAVLHSDPSQMPQRRCVWGGWNYMGSRGEGGDRQLSVTYWMNLLQSLPQQPPLFVTLNPVGKIDEWLVHKSITYHHPVFDTPAMKAQAELGTIQGQGHLWFCGSYFGYGFHEDAFSSGLAVARALGCPAPWDKTS